MLKERVVLGAAVVAACMLAAPIASAAPPEATIASPVDGTEHLVGDPALIADFSCSDDGTVASCTATVDGTPVDDGDPLPTDLGEHTLTVVAVDDEGEQDEARATYWFATNRCDDIVGTINRDQTFAVAPDCEVGPTAVVVTQPAHGTASYDADAGELVYEAPGDFTGEATFTYTADDAQPKTVSVMVDPCTDVTAEALTMRETVIAVDCGPLDPGDSIEIDVQPANGSAMVNPDGTITYVSDPGYRGTDSFPYFLREGGGDSEPATVTVDVAPIHCDEISNVEIARNRTWSVDVPCRGDWDDVTFTVGPDPAEGDASFADGKLVFEPSGDHVGPVELEYRAEGPDGAADPETIEIEVGPCADVAVTGAALTLISLPLDCGPLDEDTVVEIVDGPQHAAHFQQSGDQALYVAPRSYAGPDSFTFRLNDAGSLSTPATASISVTPYAGGSGGGGDGGGGSGGGGGGGRASDGGIVEMPPDEPGPGLPPLPFLPSLNPGGPGSGNIPTRFGRQTGVTVQDRTLRANRRGRFAIELRNVNPFAVAADLKVTGAFRKNRKGKRVPRLRLRETDLRLAAQRTTTVKLRLNRRGRRLLADERRLKLKLELRVRDVEGARRTITERFTLRAPKGAGRRG